MLAGACLRSLCPPSSPSSCLCPLAPTVPACTPCLHPQLSPLTPSARSPCPPMPSNAAHRGPAWTYRSMAAFRGATQPLPRTLPAGRCGRSQGCPSYASGAALGGVGSCRWCCSGNPAWDYPLRAPGVRAILMYWGSWVSHAVGRMLLPAPCTGVYAIPMHPGVCIPPRAPGCMQSPYLTIKETSTVLSSE